MKATIDSDLCTGCGTCVDICPEVFEMMGDVVMVKFVVVPPKYEPACEEAAAECPLEAVTLERQTVRSTE